MATTTTSIKMSTTVVYYQIWFLPVPAPTRAVCWVVAVCQAGASVSKKASINTSIISRNTLSQDMKDAITTYPWKFRLWLWHHHRRLSIVIRKVIGCLSERRISWSSAPHVQRRRPGHRRHGRRWWRNSRQCLLLLVEITPVVVCQRGVR